MDVQPINIRPSRGSEEFPLLVAVFSPLLTTMLLNHVIADKSGTEADVDEHSTQAVNFYHGRGFHTASRSETDEASSPLPVIAF